MNTAGNGRASAPTGRLPGLIPDSSGMAILQLTGEVCLKCMYLSVSLRLHGYHLIIPYTSSFLENNLGIHRFFRLDLDFEDESVVAAIATGPDDMLRELASALESSSPFSIMPLFWVDEGTVALVAFDSRLKIRKGSFLRLLGE